MTFCIQVRTTASQAVCYQVAGHVRRRAQAAPPGRFGNDRTRRSGSGFRFGQRIRATKPGAQRSPTIRLIRYAPKTAETSAIALRGLNGGLISCTTSTMTMSPSRWRSRLPGNRHLCRSQRLQSQNIASSEAAAGLSPRYRLLTRQPRAKQRMQGRPSIRQAIRHARQPDRALSLHQSRAEARSDRHPACGLHLDFHRELTRLDDGLRIRRSSSFETFPFRVWRLSPSCS
jgi:hypothetical protein